MKVSIEAEHIINEPGDGTHYDYFMIRDYDNYHFFSSVNTFKYPRKLNKWGLPTTEEAILAKAKEEDCNPFTLKECIRAIKEALK